MGERMGRVEELLSQVDALRAAGKLPEGVTREERISFVYGNCKLSNPDITREMVEAAVDGVPYPRPLCLQPMTHGDARYAEGRDTGRREGLLYAIEQLDFMAESQRGKVARLIVTSQGYQDSADRLRVRLRAGLAPFCPKGSEP